MFVKNIPYDCNEQAVRDVMAPFGVVKDVRLAVHNTSIGAPRLKGFGYVQFASEVSVNKACAAATAGTLKIGEQYNLATRESFDTQSCLVPIHIKKKEVSFKSVIEKKQTYMCFWILCLGNRALYLDFDAQAKPKGSFRRTDGTHWRETETR